MRLIPRDQQFYSMFEEIAKRVTSSATLLAKLFDEPQHMSKHVAAIKVIEHEADTLTHEVIMRINKSFVTPFDREDIYLLASQLDNVVDLIDGTARRADMFHITEVRAPAQRLCGVLVRAAKSIEVAVAGMKVYRTVIAQGQEIKLLEEEGDALYHAAVGGLFDGRPDALEVMKWKELYDTLESAIDQCEDVANVLDGIAIKNG